MAKKFFEKEIRETVFGGKQGCPVIKRIEEPGRIALPRLFSSSDLN
jgi:hypothetical protein